MVKDVLTFSLLVLETSEVASSTVETPQPIITEMEVDKPEAEQGNYFNFSNLGPLEMFYFFLDFHVGVLITF